MVSTMLRCIWCIFSSKWKRDVIISSGGLNQKPSEMRYRPFGSSPGEKDVATAYSPLNLQGPLEGETLRLYRLLEGCPDGHQW